MEKVYDYNVVGSGFGGSVASHRRLPNPFCETAVYMLGRTLYEKVNPEVQYLREVANDMNLADGFENVSVGVYMNDNNKEQDPCFNCEGPLGKPCIACAFCKVGCRENAKNFLDKNCLFFAENYLAQILAERSCAVSKIPEKKDRGTRKMEELQPCK